MSLSDVFPAAAVEAITSHVSAVVQPLETKIKALEAEGMAVLAEGPAVLAPIEREGGVILKDVEAIAVQVKAHFVKDAKAFFAWVGGLTAKGGSATVVAGAAGYLLHNWGWLKFIGL